MIHLLINYYKTNSSERNSEIDYCMNNNYYNCFIDKLHIFSNINMSNFDDPLHKISFILNDRPTYKMYFDYATHNIPENDIIILSNTDIYFDDTIQLCQNIKSSDVYALTRYDSCGNGNVIKDDGTIQIYGNSKCSQDTWIYRNYISNLDKMNINFTMGLLGCDNRIAYELFNAGYNIINPSLSIKCYHKHESNIRFYTENERLSGMYAFINISHYLE